MKLSRRAFIQRVGIALGLAAAPTIVAAAAVKQRRRSPSISEAEFRAHRLQLPALNPGDITVQEGPWKVWFDDVYLGEAREIVIN